MYSLMSMRTIAVSSSNRKLGERLGQLGLADAGRAQEHERADRPVGVLQAGARAAHGRGDGLDRLAAGRPRAWPARPPSCKQLVALAFEHLVDGNAGPARDDLGDLVGRHGLLHHGAALPSSPSSALQLLLQVRDHAVGELAGASRGRPGAAPAPARCARCVELLFELLGVAELALLGLPALRQRLATSPRARRSTSRAWRGGPWRPRPSPSSAPRARSSSASGRGRWRRAPRAWSRPACAGARRPRRRGRSPCRAGSGRRCSGCDRVAAETSAQSVMRTP